VLLLQPLNFVLAKGKQRVETSFKIAFWIRADWGLLLRFYGLRLSGTDENEAKHENAEQKRGFYKTIKNVSKNQTAALHTKIDTLTARTVTMFRG